MLYFGKNICKDTKKIYFIIIMYEVFSFLTV